MAVVQEVCPACAAPLVLPTDSTQFKCPYCSTPLSMQRSGNEFTLALANTLTASIEKSGSQTHEAIKEGSYVTQTELRRLQIAQDISMAQMRLSNVQSEIRSIERLPATALTRKQLSELRASEADLRRQIKTLSDVLSPPSPTDPQIKIASKAATTSVTPKGPGWIFFSFKGRLGRRGYWLGGIIVTIIFSIAVAITPSPDAQETSEALSMLSCMGSIFMLLTIWISLAIVVKRCHDRGKSGWWALFAMIPVIGTIWALIELGFLPGEPTPNQYG